MLNRIIFSIVAIALVAWIGNNVIESSRERAAEEAEAARAAEVTRQRVDSLTSKYSADRSWLADLSRGESYRFEPVLTIELERAWIEHGSPILFLGSIKDIKSLNPNEYQVVFARDLWSGDYMFDTELRLSLSAPKQMIDSFIAEHPDLFAEYGFNNGVAVVASVGSIESDEILSESEGSIDVRIGYGDLLDITFTGDTLF